jgi:type II secretory pathway component PulM
MKITGREKAFLWGGACILAGLLVVQLTVYPAVRRTKDLNRLIPQKEQELKELRLLRQELHSLREARAALVQKIPAGERALQPLSRLDGWIEGSGLRQAVKSIKPGPSPGGEGMTVDVLMEKAELPQLVRFLYGIQSSPGGARVVRMSLKPRYTTPRFLDVSLQMVFYQG